MEDRRREGAYARAQEHEAELRDRGIGEDALDIVLKESDGSGEERRRAADDRDDGQRRGRVGVENSAARGHVNARGHHGRRVDEGRDRGRAFHRVGKPDVERNLRGLAGGADEQQKPDRRENAEADLGSLEPRGHSLHHLVEVHRSEVKKDEHDREDEPRVTDAVDDERLLTRVRGGIPVEPEADEKVGAKSDPFPPDEGQKEVRAQHQVQHEEREHVEVGEEAPEAGVVAHVADGVHVDEKSDPRDDEHHDHRQRVEPVAPVDEEVLRRSVGLRGAHPGNPGEERLRREPTPRLPRERRRRSRRQR